MIKLVKDWKIYDRNGRARIDCEPDVCEQAGFHYGERVKMKIKDSQIILVRTEEKGKGTYSVSRRTRNYKNGYRPMIDIANEQVSQVFRIQEKVYLEVSEGQIIIRKEKRLDLFVIGEKPVLQGERQDRLTIWSAPTGAGIATACLEDTGYFRSVGGVEITNPCVTSYLHNFHNGTLYWGDIRSLHPDYIPLSDVCWLSPPCTTFSVLGKRTNGVLEGLGGHFARSVWATGAKAIMIEQVPNYFNSRSYHHLKYLLKPIFPFWYETKLEAYDFGSVTTRPRGYAVAIKEPSDFQFPQPLGLTENQRSSVGDIVGKDWDHGFGDIETSATMQYLLNKETHVRKKEMLLVSLDAKKVGCFLASYGKGQGTNTHFLHPKEPKWRKFTSQEIARFLGVPDWFTFPEWVSETGRTMLLGQSVAGQVVKAIGIELAVALMGSQIRKKIQHLFSIQTTEEVYL